MARRSRDASRSRVQVSSLLDSKQAHSPVSKLLADMQRSSMLELVNLTAGRTFKVAKIFHNSWSSLLVHVLSAYART